MLPTTHRQKISTKVFKAHHPILINTGDMDISDDLKDLFAKGPSFVTTPVHFDQLQLQRDFDAFHNRVRYSFTFSVESKD